MDNSLENLSSSDLSDIVVSILTQQIKLGYENAELSAEIKKLAKIIELARKRLDKDHPAYAVLELAE